MLEAVSYEGRRFLALLATEGANTLHAGTHVWTGAVNGYWATPGNWQNKDAPTNAAETGIVLRFPAGPTWLAIRHGNALGKWRAWFLG